MTPDGSKNRKEIMSLPIQIQIQIERLAEAEEKKAKHLRDIARAEESKAKSLENISNIIGGKNYGNGTSITEAISAVATALTKIGDSCAKYVYYETQDKKKGG